MSCAHEDAMIGASLLFEDYNQKDAYYISSNAADLERSREGGRAEGGGEKARTCLREKEGKG